MEFLCLQFVGTLMVYKKLNLVFYYIKNSTNSHYGYIQNTNGVIN